MRVGQLVGVERLVHLGHAHGELDAGIREQLLATRGSARQNDVESRGNGRGIFGSRPDGLDVLFVFHARYCSAFRMPSRARCATADGLLRNCAPRTLVASRFRPPRAPAPAGSRSSVRPAPDLGSDPPAPGRPASGRPAPAHPASDRPVPNRPAPAHPTPSRPAPDRPALVHPIAGRPTNARLPAVRSPAVRLPPVQLLAAFLFRKAGDFPELVKIGASRGNGASFFPHEKT